jgi:DegV family protein with EDD domain
MNLGRVRIVTDSTGDVPRDLASELGISVVPAQLLFGQQAFRDGVDLTPKEFFNKLANSPELPHTSGPLVADFVNTYRRLFDEEKCESIVSVHVAGNLSGTLNAAWSAAQSLPDPSRVAVIDSGQVSMGMGWAVVEAARMARDGATQAEVSQGVQDTLPRLRTAAMIDTLENLYKGGRISQVSATLGRTLQIKPLLNIDGGQVLVWGRVRTRSRALKRLVAEVLSWGPLAEMAVLHADAEDLALKLADALAGLVPADRLVIAPAGAALTTHLGLGAVGVGALVSGDDPPGDSAIPAYGAE